MAAMTRSIKQTLSRMSALIRRAGGDRRGTVALTFALAVIPICGLVGAGIDYGHATSVRVQLQAAVDSTALMLSKQATTDTADQLQTAAQKYFDAIFSRPDAQNVSVSAAYSTNGGTQVVVNGSANVPTSFMQLFGYRSLEVTGSATAKWGMSRLRVALVLDNTGSMADSNKMTELQTATNNLLSQLQNAATTDGDVYVSIVPFVKDVNVGSSNYNASWIYWGDAPPQDADSQDPSQTDNDSWDALNGSCSTGHSSTRSSCTSSGSCSISGHSSQSSCQSAGSCSSSRYTSQSTCTSHHDTWTTGTWTPGTWTHNAHSTWNGCVMDRGYPAPPPNNPNGNLNGNSGPDTANNYDTNDTPPDASTMSSLYAAEQYSACPQAVMGLSYDWTDMTTLVNDMSPNGNTNQAIGLQLGWMSIVGGGPFTAPAQDANYTYQHVIILLTDGLNTQDRWYSNESQIDARQSLTCTNIKASGVIIYTVQVSTDGTPESTLLENCASDSSKFFFLTSASQIVTTFSAIGTNLSQLYLAR
jgi:Flp pilus assembly protein TadG